MPTTPHALFSEIIDYAGLFPPARLPMNKAWSCFLGHRAGGDGWLVARFVCPATWLDQLAPLLVAEAAGGPQVRVAVLGTGGDDAPTFAAALERDLASMTAFADRVGDRARMDVFEVKLPLLSDPAETIDYACDALNDAGAAALTPFFEAPLLGDWQDRLANSARAAAMAGHEIDPGRRVGLKIRCGGLDSAAVPDVEAVAAAVVACRGHEVPLKATQGLHHAFRHHDAALGVEVHGFVNLLAATLFAREHRLDAAQVRLIVADTDPGAFTLTDRGLRWRELEIAAAAIASGRADGFTGFGSCSFSEPRDDLAALGWL